VRDIDDRGIRLMIKMASLAAATYGSEMPKSVVSVMMRFKASFP